MRRSIQVCRLMLVALAMLTGCARENPELSAQRTRLMLADEPAGAVSVLDVREEGTLPGDVVLLGQIGGVDSPWTEGRASFVIADPSVLMEEPEHHADAPGHDPKTCPFCKRNQVETATDALAVVQFTDPKGQVLPLDARKLFGLSERQMVVVRGRAEIDKSGCLVVSADGLYIRR